MNVQVKCYITSRQGKQRRGEELILTLHAALEKKELYKSEKRSGLIEQISNVGRYALHSVLFDIFRHFLLFSQRAVQNG